MPQYSGGLGILAGDHLKAAADLGVPLVAVGLFYRHGYFRQQLDPGGRQTEQFPRLVPATMAMEQVDDLHIGIPLGGNEVSAALWRVAVDTVPLYLLDTEVELNASPDQLVTDRLYGGESEQRIRQELMLGVGGLRALQALGVVPDVFHLNEGHAGFLALELIHIAIRDHDLSYDEAVEAVRPRLVFTTHTPVPTGIDRFPRADRALPRVVVPRHRPLARPTHGPRPRARRRRLDVQPRGDEYAPLRMGRWRVGLARRREPAHVRGTVAAAADRGSTDRLGDERRARSHVGG